MKKAFIKTVKRGKNKGKFVFILTAVNGEAIATSQTYTQKHNVTEILTEHFPDFEITDLTK